MTSAYVSVYAQNGKLIQVKFDPVYEGSSLHIDDEAEVVLDSTDILVDLFRCYISNVELIKQDVTVMKESDSFHLLDAESSETLTFPLEIGPKMDFDSIRFMVGIDSLTSVSGAMGGDLDPTKGMFWTWNTGYIFFKVEGQSLICDTRKHRFVYHLGGYDGPFAAQRWVTLPVDTSEDINITIDLDAFMQQVDLVNLPNLMSPGEEALEYSQIASSIFKIAR